MNPLAGHFRLFETFMGILGGNGLFKDTFNFEDRGSIPLSPKMRACYMANQYVSVEKDDADFPCPCPNLPRAIKFMSNLDSCAQSCL